MSDDQQQTAEGLDPDELGDDPTGSGAFPPDRPMGVDDPTRDDRYDDSVAERSAREEPETDLDAIADVDSPDDHPRLLAPNDVELDDESTAIAESAEFDDDPDLSAEEAAIHVIVDETPS